MQAMILAAGFGTRLLPHTALRPKPLFPLLNQPLLLLTIRRLQRHGFDHIIVNCHHLGEQIVAALAGLPGVVVQREERILGTGGGLRLALARMRDEPILITNGDIYHTVDYGELVATHRRGGCRATLAVHDYPRFNSVVVEGGRIVDFAGAAGPDRLAFTGLQVIDPAILTELPLGEPACIIDHYRRLLGQGEGLYGHRVDGSFWTDMGTPADYLALHGGLLTGKIPHWPELADPVGPLFVDREAQLGADCRLLDWVCLGAVWGGGGARLERVVAWDGVALPTAGEFTDAVLSESPIDTGTSSRGDDK